MEQLFALVVGVCVVVVVVVEANHSKHIFFTFHVAPIIFLICHWFGQCLQNKNEQNKDFILKRLFSLCFGFQFCAQQKFHSKQSLHYNTSSSNLFSNIQVKYTLEVTVISYLSLIYCCIHCPVPIIDRTQRIGIAVPSFKNQPINRFVSLSFAPGVHSIEFERINTRICWKRKRIEIYFTSNNIIHNNKNTSLLLFI